MKNKCCPAYNKSSEKCVNCKYEKENREITAEHIVLECKSFYMTFKLVEPYYLKQIHNMENHIIDEEDIKNAALYIYSYVVNGAFAVELAMKYLLTLANIEYCTGNKGHDLLDLYKKLSVNKKEITADRKVIVERLCELGHQNEETIIKNLESLKNCYIYYRYLFSYGSVGISGFLGVFVNVVCNYAIEKAKSLAEGSDE